MPHALDSRLYISTNLIALLTIALVTAGCAIEGTGSTITEQDHAEQLANDPIAGLIRHATSIPGSAMALSGFFASDELRKAVSFLHDQYGIEVRSGDAHMQYVLDNLPHLLRGGFSNDTDALLQALPNYGANRLDIALSARETNQVQDDLQSQSIEYDPDAPLFQSSVLSIKPRMLWAGGSRPVHDEDDGPHLIGLILMLSNPASMADVLGHASGGTYPMYPRALVSVINMDELSLQMFLSSPDSEALSPVWHTSKEQLLADFQAQTAESQQAARTAAAPLIDILAPTESELAIVLEQQATACDLCRLQVKQNARYGYEQIANFIGAVVLALSKVAMMILILGAATVLLAGLELGVMTFLSVNQSTVAIILKVLVATLAIVALSMSVVFARSQIQRFTLCRNVC